LNERWEVSKPNSVLPQER